MISAAAILHRQVSSVCPVLSVSVGLVSDRSTWGVTFDPAATAAQKNTANGLLSTFDLAGAVATAIQDNAAVGADADFADLLTKLQSATPTQIKNYVQNNVTDLPSAKILLAKILLALSLLIGAQ